MTSLRFATGLDRLVEEQRVLLRGRRVAVLAHPASLLVNGDWAPQRLHDQEEMEVRALWCPEHGLFGEAGAGDSVPSSRHPRWKIPVHSLYGDHRRPTADMFEGIDLVVVDLQDLAVRCYTFVSTLRLVLQAANEAAVPVAVTDRPVPFPDTMDGPMPEPGAESFVCGIPAPLVYGMTPAETARWLVKRDGLSVDVHALAMSGYVRNARRPAGAPPWVPPSTGIRSWETAWCYPVTVFTEALPSLDCDRAGLLPFQVLGAPWMKGEAVARVFAEDPVPGLRVVPHDYVSVEGTCLEGIRCVVTDPSAFAPVTAGFRILSVLQTVHGRSVLWEGEGTRPEFFDQLCGSAAPRHALQDGIAVTELVQQWEKDREHFREERRESLLYGTEAGSLPLT